MWILYAIATALLLSLSAVFLKCGARKADATVTTALRTLVVAIVMWVVLLTDGKVSSLSSVSSNDWLYLILTAIAMTVGLICYHISLRNGTAASVTALQRTVQLVIMILAIVLWGHTSSLYLRIICAVLIALGIILAVTKRSRANGSWLLFGLLSSAAVVGAYILNGYVKGQLLVTVLIITAILLISLIAVFIRGIQHGIGRIPFGEIMFIILSGLTAGGAWFCYRLSDAYASQTAVTAIVSMSLITTAGLSALFTKEKISWKTICGLLLITTGTLLYIFLV